MTDDFEDDRGIGDNSLAGDERLRLLVERIETLEEEIKAVQDDRKDVYAEAKAVGYDSKVLRRIVRDRKRNRDDRMEEEAVYETYAAALGML